MVLKGVIWVHNDKVRSNGLKRGQLGKQYKNQVIWSWKESSGHTMIKSNQMVLNESFWYTVIKWCQMVLKGVNWVHNDTIRSNGFKGVNRVYNDKMMSNGLERS